MSLRCDVLVDTGTSHLTVAMLEGMRLERLEQLRVEPSCADELRSEVVERNRCSESAFRYAIWSVADPLLALARSGCDSGVYRSDGMSTIGRACGSQDAGDIGGDTRSRCVRTMSGSRELNVNR